MWAISASGWLQKQLHHFHGRIAIDEVDALHRDLPVIAVAAEPVAHGAAEKPLILLAVLEDVNARAHDDIGPGTNTAVMRFSRVRIEHDVADEVAHPRREILAESARMSDADDVHLEPHAVLGVERDGVDGVLLADHRGNPIKAIIGVEREPFLPAF